MQVPIQAVGAAAAAAAAAAGTYCHCLGETRDLRNASRHWQHRFVSRQSQLASLLRLKIYGFWQQSLRVDDSLALTLPSI